GLAQGPVGVPGATAETLARALVVARAQAGPRGGVAGGREARHVAPELGDDDLSRAPCDPRDGVEPGERVGLRRGEGRDLAVAGRDGVVEELDVAQCPPVPDGRAETLPPDRR